MSLAADPMSSPNCEPCPTCATPIDLGDWNPYTSDIRRIRCLACGNLADIEWDDDQGWFVWLSPSGPGSVLYPTCPAQNPACPASSRPTLAPIGAGRRETCPICRAPDRRAGVRPGPDPGPEAP